MKHVIHPTNTEFIIYIHMISFRDIKLNLLENQTQYPKNIAHIRITKNVEINKGAY